MPSDSKTANALMSWGSNVAASQRANPEEIPASWKRTDRSRLSASKRSATPPSTQQQHQGQQLQDKCNKVAQRLLDEGNELQYCEQILVDNEIEFEKREKELLQALAEIKQGMDKPPSKPIAEEVSLKEEALWHLESTLRRLEEEETAQGQAVVALAGCVSCCQTTDAQAKQHVQDTATLVKNRVLPLIRDLRDVCLSFRVSNPTPTQFADDRCEIEVAEAIAKLSTDRPLRVILIEAINRLIIRCNDLRNTAAKRADSLLDETVDHRQECERLSVTVHKAHSTIAALKERSDAMQNDIQEALKAEELLRADLEVKFEHRAALQTTLDAHLQQKETLDRTLSSQESELLALLSEINTFKVTTQEQHSQRDAHAEAKYKLEKDGSQLQVAMQTAMASSSGVIDSIRDINRKVTSMEADVAKLEEHLRSNNEEENAHLLSVQAVHTKCLDKNTEIAELSKRQKLSQDEASSLQRNIQEVMADIDANQSRLAVLRGASETDSVRERSLKSDLESEVEKASQLGMILDSLKDQLLKQKADHAPKSRLDYPPDNKKVIIQQPSQPILDPQPFSQLPTQTQIPPPHVARQQQSQPYVASKLENVVSTAPLAQLLLTDARVPWRVPLEPRYHRQPAAADAERSRLMQTFQL